jgi:hypothetical protein
MCGLPMSISRRPIISTELLASRKPFVDGIYVVGPFATRVSFSSQQRRSISLVCDIHEDFKKAIDSSGISGRDVCVVGAGLAGITCAAVAAALGARVYILDAEPSSDDAGEEIGCCDILATIREAVHRDGHPSLNFWPHEDIEPITRLPLLNWYEGSCEEVAEQIVAEFRRLRTLDKMGNRILGVIPGRKVTGLRRVPPQSAHGRARWRLVTEPESSALDRWDNVYDVLIFATGFGAEVNEYGTPSYWSASQDRIPLMSAAPPSEFANFIVSGTGDGGLIEMLRLLFKGKRAGNIEEEMMLLVSDDNIRDEVAKIENEAAKMQNDYVVHGGQGGMTKEAKDHVSRFLWTRYLAVVSRWTTDMLRERLQTKRSTIAQVTLVGQWEYAMELSASPFHRLMLAICHQYGWVSFVQCAGKTRTRNPRDVSLSGGVTARMVDVSISLASRAGRRTIYRDAFFVARHGYQSPLRKIWSKIDLARIRHQQALFADQDQLKREYTRDISDRVDSSDPGDIEAFYRGSKDLIQAYFRKRYGLGVKLITEGQKRGIILTGGTPGAHYEPAIPMRIFENDILNRSSPEKVPRLDRSGGL